MQNNLLESLLTKLRDSKLPPTTLLRNRYSGSYIDTDLLSRAGFHCTEDPKNVAWDLWFYKYNKGSEGVVLKISKAKFIGAIEHVEFIDIRDVYGFMAPVGYIRSQYAKAIITGYFGSISDLIIPEKLDNYLVTAIEIYAFSNHDSLTSVTLPDSIACIGSFAFSSCKNLKTINLPEKLDHIGVNPFKDTPVMLKLSPKNQRFVLIDGLLYSKIKNELVCYSFPDIPAVLIIPDGITGIGDFALYGCENVNSIKLPNGLTNIGESAFSWCYGLQHVIQVIMMVKM